MRRFSHTKQWIILASAAAVIAAGLVSCGDGSEWDGVVELGYTEEALVRRVKRRIGLVSAGVALRDKQAADSVWTNVAGHTFIARSPDGGETEIVFRRAKRMGISVRGGGRGITRMRLGQFAIDEGFHIVDLFSPHDRYIVSAVAPTSMSGRQVMQHLGVVRKHSEQIDRFHLDPEEIVHWRELFNVVVRNRGFGPLYLRGASGAGHTESDSLRLFAQRYELDEVGDFVLVGKNHHDQSYRHIFSAGGKYLMSAIQYGEVDQNGLSLLEELGLVVPEGSGESGTQGVKGPVHPADL